jgi:hypothetical protein
MRAQRIRIEYDAMPMPAEGCYAEAIWVDGQRLGRVKGVRGAPLQAALAGARAWALEKARACFGGALVTVVQRGAAEGPVVRPTKPADLLVSPADPSAETVDLGVVA